MKRTQSKNKKIELSHTDMWSLRHNEIDGGIEGYFVPKEIYDYREVKWNNERLNIFKNPKKYTMGPKQDKEGNVIIPHRPNFLDEVTKWANSFYDKEKAEKTKEECEGKGHPLFPDKPKKKEANEIKYPKREYYTDLIIRQEQKKYKQLEDREDLIADIVEKTKEWEKSKKSYSDKLKEKYGTKDDNGNPKITTFGKEKRATFVTESEHLGEKIPFYNTYVDPDGDEEPKDPKKRKLFFPSVSILLNFII